MRARGACECVGSETMSRYCDTIVRHIPVRKYLPTFDTTSVAQLSHRESMEDLERTRETMDRFGLLK